MTSQPTIKSGKLHVGSDVYFGRDVVIDVAEEVVIGDRCVIPDNAYFSGRRVAIGSDFYGYSWEWQRLDIGRGRIDEEYATLFVGDRCTFHANKIDLAKSVTIGNDVGLSPEVTIYTHGYWQSCLEGYPCKYAPVTIGSGTVIGYRSTILPGSVIGERCVVGAQSVVTGKLLSGFICAGNPAKSIGPTNKLSIPERKHLLDEIMFAYTRSCAYRNVSVEVTIDYPMLAIRECLINVEDQTLSGEEDAYTDDLREFLFKRGIRIYTKRRFNKLPRTI